MKKKIYKYYLVRSKSTKRTQGAFPFDEIGKINALRYAKKLDKESKEKFEVVKG